MIIDVLQPSNPLLRVSDHLQQCYHMYYMRMHKYPPCHESFMVVLDAGLLLNDTSWARCSDLHIFIALQLLFILSRLTDCHSFDTIIGL